MMNDVLFVSLANLMIPKRLRVCLNTKTEVYILDKVRPSYFGAEPRFFTTSKSENVVTDMSRMTNDQVLKKCGFTL